MEVTLNFVDCLVCNVTFCPVTLAPQSEDEKLLDIFCHYFDLSPKDVEKVYDERVGFPFCDDCRERTLLSLSQFHDQLTSIQNEINQLVTDVCTSIVNIVSQNNFNDSKPIGVKHDPDQDAGNYSKGAIADIRKSITNRFNPQVSLIRLDFQNLSRQLKNLEKQKKKRKIDDQPPTSSGRRRRQPRRVRVSQMPKKEDLNEIEELLSDVDPSSIVEIMEDETFSPSAYCKDEESDIDSLEFAETDSSNSSLASIRRKAKSTTRVKLEYTSDSNSKLGMKAEEEHDGDGSSKSKKSPVKTGPRKPGRPKKGFELNKKLIPRKWKWGSGKSKDREYQQQKKLRDKLDPLIEVEPNLFRRKKSGWSFRKEQIEGVEMFVCLAEGCHGKYDHKTTMMQHMTLEHINNRRVKCSKCGKAYWTQEQLDQHICVPQIPSGTAVFKKTQDFGNGQYIYDGIWPFYEVDVVENDGCDMKCGTCGNLSREQRRMVEHIRRVHLEKVQYSCEICCKTFNSNYALRRHVTRHSDKREAICEKCGASFKTQKTLETHVRLKHEKSPKSFKCDFPNCGRGFTYSYGLTRHRRTAGHPKQAQPKQPRFLIDPIICPLCDNKFVKEKLYNKHRETCRGKKEFICPICDKKSFGPQQLRIHMALMHKDEYMNYPEGRLQKDPNKTADSTIARIRLTSKKVDMQRRDKKRAQALQQRLEKLKKLKQNQSTSSS